MHKTTALLLILSVLIVLCPVSAQASMDAPRISYERARILSVQKPSMDDFKSAYLQQARVLVLSGKLKGREINLSHVSSGGMAGPAIKLAKGDKVILYVEENPSIAESPDGSPLIHIDDYARDTPLLWLAIIFAGMLVLVGGRKGLKSLISLVLTMLIIFFILFPLTLKGFSPLLVSIVISGVVSLMVFRIVGGKTKKALSAAIGTLIGVSIAGALAMIVGIIIHLNGVSSEEAKMLLYSLNIKINFQGLLFSGILIGSLGAIMDVGMSIASAIDEVRKVHPEANFTSLFNAGMNVGRDVMGTMSNTLILAYAGASLPLLLLFMAGNIPFIKIVNMEIVSEEIVRALAGSIGLILCIPITAFVSAAMYTRPKKMQSRLPNDWLQRKGS